MIDEKKNLKFTTADDYIDEWKKKSDEGYKPELDAQATQNPTGFETWQTKATAKGAVPRYYSPTELLSMRVDKLEDMVRNLNERLSNISSEMFQEIEDDEIYNKPKGER